MVSVKASGSQAATVDTAHSLNTVTDAGTYALVVDASAMVDGDGLTLRLFGKARSGDTERLLLEANYANALGQPLIHTVPFVSPHHFRAELEQSGAAGRTFPWAIYEA